MSRGLTAEQVRRFEKDGVLFPLRVATDSQAARARNTTRRISKLKGGPLSRIDFCHLFFRWAFDLVTRPAVLDAVESLVGPDIVVHSGRVMYKHPHDPVYVSWHQDGVHTVLGDTPMVTAWIALTDCCPENGGLRVVKGSHHGSVLSHTKTDREKGALNNAEIPELAIAEDQVVDVLLEPGEMSLHHAYAVHGSDANRSDRERIGVSVTYVTPGVKDCTYPVVHARGQSELPGFQVFDPPAECPLEQAIAEMEMFVDARRRG